MTKIITFVAILAIGVCLFLRGLLNIKKQHTRYVDPIANLDIILGVLFTTLSVVILVKY